MLEGYFLAVSGQCLPDRAEFDADLRARRKRADELG